MLRITNGEVYDPANGINGEVRDICIDEGCIVDSADDGREICVRPTQILLLDPINVLIHREK